MEKQALLRMSHISKKFSGNYVLFDVSFTLEAGTIHSLIGENGAGKSTLIYRWCKAAVLQCKRCVKGRNRNHLSGI